jgi:hypothetical protein
MSFNLFCHRATDRQLANIIQKENRAGRSGDLDIAEREALARGWDEARIRDARKNGAP